MAVTNIRGVFGLSDYRKRQLSGLVPEKIRPVFREYGYFAGGVTLGLTVDRIDYSNDTATASVRGPLVATTYGAGSTGNENFGYIASGGSQGTLIQTRVQRINYSNDTSTSYRTNLSTGRGRCFGATSNKNYGYFGGGRKSGTGTTIIDRLDYSNDLLNASRIGNFSRAKGEGSAAGNSDFGWYKAGNQTDRIDYSNDFSSPLERANFINGGSLSQATGNSNFGYFVRGYDSGGPKTDVYRLDYSNDLNTIPIRFNLSTPNSSVSATGNSNFGYFHLSEVSSVSYSIVNRCDYSNDTATSSVRGAVSSSRSFTSATSSASFGGTPNSLFASNYKFPTVPNAGYFSGGLDSNDIEIFTIQKIDYSNDTASTSPRSGLPIDYGSVSSSATSNSNFGYIAGGGPGGPVYSVIRRLDYSNDNAPTSLRGNLSVARNTRHSAAGNSNFGYFYGGNSGGSGFSTLDRIDYSNDLLDVPTRANLTDREIAGGTGNSNFGYFGGGVDPSNNTLSIIERIDYSNDTLIPPVSFLGLPVRNVAATGNQSFGYFGAGRTSPGNVDISNVQRIDYSNDTQNSPSRGNLTFSEQRHAATGNNSFGYFSGGGAGGVINSQVCRLNYANDTAIAPARGSFPSGRVYHAGLSPLEYGGAPNYFTNQLPQVLQDQITFDDSNTLELPYKRALGSYGYWGTTYPPGIRTDVYRLDFSNDNMGLNFRSFTSESATEMATFANSNFGYFSAGAGTTNNQRVDFSNDTANSSSRSALVNADRRLSGVGNKDYGYACGGSSTPSNKFVRRLDYSNDNSSSLRGNLLLGTSYPQPGAAGNENFGYVTSSESLTRVDRIQYSNDNVSTQIRNLFASPSAITGRGPISNKNFGYYCGGVNVSPRISEVFRLDYSNDTNLTSIRGPLTGNAVGNGTGDENYGYFLSASNGSSVRSLDRIDYSNDSTIATRISSTPPILVAGFGSFTNSRFS